MATVDKSILVHCYFIGEIRPQGSFKKCINVSVGEMFPGEKTDCKYRYSLLEKDVSSKLIKVKSNIDKSHC